MSKPVKAAGPESPAVAEISFEEALKKLGSIVQAMENDDLPLEKLLTQRSGERLEFRADDSARTAIEIGNHRIDAVEARARHDADEAIAAHAFLR